MNRYMMIITWLLSLVMFTGCGSPGSDEGGGTTPPSTETVSLSKTM